MSLTLSGFSQEVDIDRPDVVNYFLVFRTKDGSDLRLPVQKQATEALINHLYSSPSQPPVKQQAEETLEMSTEETEDDSFEEEESLYTEAEPDPDPELEEEDAIPSI